MKISVVILTEAGNKRGLGHLVRCSSIYEAFCEKGIKPEVYVDVEGAIDYRYSNFSYKKINWLENKSKILGILEKADVVIIDSYLADQSFYEKVSRKAAVPVFIDDTAKIDYPKGIVVNSSLYASKLFSKKKENNEYLLGCKYIPLRAIFKESRDRVKNNIENNQILIMFGGTDIAGLSERILKLLCESDFEDAKKVVVSATRLDFANNIAGSFRNVEILCNPEPQTLADKMASSSVAISAAGMTLYELAYLQIPTIAVCVADNQKRGLLEFVKIGFVEEFLSCDDADLLEKIKCRLSFMIANYDKVKEQAQVGRQIVDGRGSERIVRRIMEVYNEKSINIGRQP